MLHLRLFYPHISISIFIIKKNVNSFSSSICVLAVWEPACVLHLAELFSDLLFHLEDGSSFLLRNVSELFTATQLYIQKL
jgi:hypothetical protein